MNHSRRQFMAAAAAASAFSLSGCIGPHASPYGNGSSYASQILKPQNRNAVFDWIDAALQQVRDQRIPPPRAAYTCALPMAAGFLAANGIVQAYDEPFGIGAGPAAADPEVAYGVAFATAAAEAFQQPFLFDRIAFLNRFPGSEGKSQGVGMGPRGRPASAQDAHGRRVRAEQGQLLSRPLRKAHGFLAVASHRTVLPRHAGPGVRIFRPVPVSRTRKDQALDNDWRLAVQIA